MARNLFVFLHLVGVVLFIGGFLSALLLHARANRTRDQRLIGYSFSVIDFNDKWFTPFSILLIMGGGFGAAAEAGLPIVGTGWIFWPLILFGFTGLLFVFRALPLQNRIVRLAQADTFDWAAYDKLSRSWTRVAVPSFLIVAVAFVLMVFKPDI